jgi:cyclopropane fatty-acyl-phospholipid synthase-like methyltransferase
MTKDDDHISLVQSGYDQIAESYHERRVSRKDANVVFLDSLKDKLPPHGKVLDMGCGGGVPISQYFAERGYEVTGFDISEEMIALAKQSVPQAKFFVQDMQTVTFGEKEFALIVSFFAIIHVPREHHASLFKKMFEWLQNDGTLRITLGGTNMPEFTKTWHDTEMYWSFFDKTENKKLLEQAGFEILWSKEETYSDNMMHYFVLAKKQTR